MQKYVDRQDLKPMVLSSRAKINLIENKRCTAWETESCASHCIHMICWPPNRHKDRSHCENLEHILMSIEMSDLGTSCWTCNKCELLLLSNAALQFSTCGSLSVVRALFQAKYYKYNWSQCVATESVCQCMSFCSLSLYVTYFFTIVFVVMCMHAYIYLPYLETVMYLIETMFSQVSGYPLTT